MRITPNFDAASPARLAKCFALTAAAARSTGSARSMRCDVFADSFDIFSYWRSVSETHSPVYLLSCFGPVFAGGPLVIRFSLLLYRPLFSIVPSTRLLRPDDVDSLFLSLFYFTAFPCLLLTNAFLCRRRRASGAAINTPRLYRRHFFFRIFDAVNSVFPAPYRPVLLLIST